MKKSKALIYSISLLLLLSSAYIAPKNSDAAVIVVKTLTWDLVDSGKHLDWGGSSSYLTSFTSAIPVWNNYKAGIIRQDTASTIQDLRIYDYYEVSNYAALASSGGTIRFNSYHMSGYTSTKRKNVAIHELGHVLGLAHNQSNDIMYSQVSSIVTLSINDKASYDAAYKKY